MQALHIYNLLKAGKSDQAMLELEQEAKEQLFDLHKQNLVDLRKGETTIQPDFIPAKPGKAKHINMQIFWSRFNEHTEKFGMKKIVAQSLGFLSSNRLPRSIREHRTGTIMTVYADHFASVFGQDLIVQKPDVIVTAEKGAVREINGPIFRERFAEYAKGFSSQFEAVQSLGISSTSHSPFRALLDKRVNRGSSCYADHLARFLGVEILGIEKEVTVKNEVVTVAYTNSPRKYKDELVWIDCGKARAAFKKVCEENSISQNSQAKLWGFKGSNQLTFFINNKGPVQTSYGKFLIEVLGEQIACAPPEGWCLKKNTAKNEKTVTSSEQKSDTSLKKSFENDYPKRVLQPEDFRPVPKPTTMTLQNSEKRKPSSFTPATSSYRTYVSDFNLFEVSERDMTLRSRARDFSDMPGFKKELEEFLKSNAELFRSYPTWNEAKEALFECDRRWKNRERTISFPSTENDRPGIGRKLSRKK